MSGTRYVPSANQPWDGLFFGNPTHADTVSSTPVKGGEAVWLRVPIQRSGSITGVLFEIRRCQTRAEASSRSPGNYSHGDGGKLRLQIRPIGADAEPTTNVLAQSRINNGFAESLCHGGLWNTAFAHYQVWKLDRAVPVEKGQQIALWIQNEDTDPDRGNWSALNFMELYSPIPYGQKQREGPDYGDIPKCIRVRWWGAAQARKGSGGLWELRYADGISDGVPYYFSTGQLRKTIGGTRMIRQKFTLEGDSLVVNGVWLRAFWTDDQTSDLKLRVEDSAEHVLEELDIPRSRFTRTDAFQDSPPALWVHASLGKPQHLVAGQTYYVCLSAASGNYIVHPMEQMPRPLSASRNRWDGAYAQYSTDGGASWFDGWDRKDQPGRLRKDVILSLAFTVAR